MDLFELYGNIKKLQDTYNVDENGGVDLDSLFMEAGLDLQELEEKMMNPDARLLLRFKRDDISINQPIYNYPTDSGFDLYSTVDVTIEPLGRALIPTGLYFDISDGYEIQVRTKSGLALNEGLMVLNSPGTVDCGYIGEIKVILFNTNQNPYQISKGMKVAQAVVCPVINGKWIKFEEVSSLEEKDRNDNGFGSTGI